MCGRGAVLQAGRSGGLSQVGYLLLCNAGSIITPRFTDERHYRRDLGIVQHMPERGHNKRRWRGFHAEQSTAALHDVYEGVHSVAHEHRITCERREGGGITAPIRAVARGAMIYIDFRAKLRSVAVAKGQRRFFIIDPRCIVFVPWR